MALTEPVSSPNHQALIGTYVDPSLKRQAVELARNNDRSLSAEVRLALRRHLASQESEANPLVLPAA